MFCPALSSLFGRGGWRGRRRRRFRGRSARCRGVVAGGRAALVRAEKHKAEDYQRGHHDQRKAPDRHTAPIGNIRGPRRIIVGHTRRIVGVHIGHRILQEWFSERRNAVRRKLVRMEPGRSAAAGQNPAQAGLSGASDQELSAIHLSTELFFAAPASGLPSLLTAAVSQHFLIAEVFAAPASGLPSLVIASFLQDCASAGLTPIGERNAVAMTKPASVAAVVTIRIIGVSLCALAGAGVALPSLRRAWPRARPYRRRGHHSVTLERALASLLELRS